MHVLMTAHKYLLRALVLVSLFKKMYQLLREYRTLITEESQAWFHQEVTSELSLEKSEICLLNVR